MQWLAPGTRTTIAGKTGCGKTTLATALLAQSRQCWIIVDAKHDTALAALNPARVDDGNLDKISRAWARGSQYVAVTLPPGSTPDDYDDLILAAYERFANFGLFVDELYLIHRNGRAGPGLEAILTRGRSTRNTYLGLTQRPRWVSMFCFSEAEAVIGMQLTTEADRKRIVELTGADEFLKPLDKFVGLCYLVDSGSTFIVRTED